MYGTKIVLPFCGSANIDIDNIVVATPIIRNEIVIFSPVPRLQTTEYEHYNCPTVYILNEKLPNVALKLHS